jgi:hypothetical protein
MSEQITKDDLRQFSLLIIGEVRKIVQAANEDKDETIHLDWLKSRTVRKMLDMSPASMQNLRITGKVRCKKVMGSYYYNKTDLLNLFGDK